MIEKLTELYVGLVQKQNAMSRTLCADVTLLDQQLRDLFEIICEVGEFIADDRTFDALTDLANGKITYDSFVEVAE